jgi:hypothetical protein
MNVKIWTPAAHFLFWEYINRNFIAVYSLSCLALTYTVQQHGHLLSNQGTVKPYETYP